MTILVPAVSGFPAGLSRVLPILYAATLFLSALLLFLVQPMFSKMVLPRLGGAPAVWSVAMVFFQAALLAGYAYAHLLVRRFSAGPGALIHLAVLAAAALTLPIGIAQAFGAPPANGIALWVLALFAISIGLPFAALSASAPLLQSWFGASGHANAGNPYVLYAASNLGSFAALIAYPLSIEPFVSLANQARLWSIAFALVVVGTTLASLFVVHRPALATESIRAEPVQARARLRWIALAAIPAGLVIAVTSYISTDIAAAPFLWVIPLALYLITFVLVFRERAWPRHETVARLVPIVVAPLAIGLLGGDKLFWLAMIAVNLLAFTLLALLCHGELYRARPAPARLSEFYLCTALGGVLGGIFAALVAPHVFSRIYEYPILLAAAVLCLPGMFAHGLRRMLEEAGPILGLAAVAATARLVLDIRLPAAAELPFMAGLVALATLMMIQRHRPARFFALTVLAFVITALWQPGLQRVETARSFFGVHQVVETSDGRHRLLYHGTTLHGAERIDHESAGAAPEPLTYYYRGGPISEGIEAVRAARRGLARVAVVGLGTGSLACHQRGDEAWTFFEIDPEVVRIARDARRFRFASVCSPDTPVVLGDARLTLSGSAARYDLIILDAFSSDAIPVHLLTRQAIAGFLPRLAAGGALMLHISNRHMDLGPAVAATAAAEGLVTYVKLDERPETLPTDFKMNALVAMLARDSADLGDLPGKGGWRELAPEPGIAPWTDDYADLLSAIMRKKLAR